MACEAMNSRFMSFAAVSLRAVVATFIEKYSLISRKSCARWVAAPCIARSMSLATRCGIAARAPTPLNAQSFRSTVQTRWLNCH